MALSFAELKKNRSTSLTKLAEEVNKMQAGNTPTEDDRIWYPAVDKAGNGFAVVRFLPAPAGEDVPFVRMWSHAFQGPGGWYIENSLTTIGQQDPIAEMNSELWNSTTDDDSPARKTVRARKRKLTYISNVLVLKDPANPENEGKVKIYKYGKKVFDKLNEAMNPQFEDEEPMNPFDLWEGADFKIKIRQVEGYRNYDKSEFDKQRPLFDNDDEIETVWKQAYSLQDFIAPDKFKTYEELQKQLNKALKVSATNTPAKKAAASVGDETEAPRGKRTEAKSAPASDDDDDTLDYFKGLSDEDTVPF